jgi:hypothetical protein
MEKKESKTSLAFSNTIYPSAIVNKAVRQYAEHIAISSHKDGRNTYVYISGIEPEEIESITGEFGNYVLYLTREVQSRT